METQLGQIEPQPPSNRRLLILAGRILEIVVAVGILLFVVGVIAFNIFVPWMRNFGSAAVCSNNMRNLSLALHAYHDRHGSFPPAYLVDAEGKPMHSWRVLILPYLGHRNLYHKYNFKEPWNGPNNSRLTDQMPSVFHCPSSQAGPGVANYVAVVGPETAWPGAREISLHEITDGAKQTILLVEIDEPDFHWLEPRDLPVQQALLGVNPIGELDSISNRHSAGANVFFCDGSSGFLHNKIRPDVLNALLTLAGGEVVNEKDY